MALDRLIYVSRIALPNTYAHSIQMMRTCHSIAGQGVHVDFYVRGEDHLSPREVLDYYGLEPLENLCIHWLAHRQWEGAGFLYTATVRLRRKGVSAALYTRDYHLARRFARLRPLTGTPVVVETHKRDGYFELGYRTDAEDTVGPAALDTELVSDRYDLIDDAYRRASGVVAAWIDTFHVLAARYPATPLLRAWFPTDPRPARPDGLAGRSGICYVGNLYPRYRPGVLIDALSRLDGETLHIIGGSEEDLTRFQHMAAERGLADCLKLHGYVEPGQIGSVFERFRVAVALLPGLKITEYFSHGLPVVAPDIPIARDLLRDGDTCLLFEPGNGASLAAAIRRILEDPQLALRLAHGALAEARKHAGPRRARRIIDFIESLL